MAAITRRRQLADRYWMEEHVSGPARPLSVHLLEDKDEIAIAIKADRKFVRRKGRRRNGAGRLGPRWLGWQGTARRPHSIGWNALTYSPALLGVGQVPLPVRNPRARRRWFLYYTLINNPALRVDRTKPKRLIEALGDLHLKVVAGGLSEQQQQQQQPQPASRSEIAMDEL